MDIRNRNKVNINKSIFPTQEKLNLRKPSLEISKSKENKVKDMVNISNEARVLLSQDESLFHDNDNEKIKEIEEMVEELEKASDKTDSPLEVLIKCIKISVRIINGDKVPLKDMKFLAENEPGLYSNAILLRQQNDKPKKHDSLIDDEKENTIKLNNELREVVQELIQSKDIEALSESQE